MATEKQYTIEEIEQILSTERIPMHYTDVGKDTPDEAKRTIIGMYAALNTTLVASAPAIIKQLLAKVKEAEEVEEMLRCSEYDITTIKYEGRTVQWDGAGGWITLFNNGDFDKKHGSLLSALKSLTWSKV